MRYEINTNICFFRSIKESTYFVLLQIYLLLLSSAGKKLVLMFCYCSIIISQYWRCFIKKLFLYFAKVTEKRLCKYLFFNKVAGLILFYEHVLLKKRLKKEALTLVFSCELCDIVKNKNIFYRTAQSDCF